MQAAQVLNVLWGQGFTVTLADNGGLKVSPSSTLQDSQRELLREHRSEIVTLLIDAQATTAQLLAAAMRACACHHDGEPARAQMRQDCMATPPHLRNDLLAHFNEAYPNDLPDLHTPP